MLPTLTQQASCDLAENHSRIAFGPTDEVLASKSGTIIVKYKCSNNLLTVIWEKAPPQGMGANSYKFITGNGEDIVLHNPGTTPRMTHVYSSELALESQYTAGGMFLLAVTRDRLLYWDNNDGQFVVSIYNMRHQKIVSLRPPGREWSNYLSVSAVSDSGNVIVADITNKWLDVFSSGGTIIIHTH